MKHKKWAGRALGLLGVLLVVSGCVLVVTRPPQTQPRVARSPGAASPTHRAQPSLSGGTPATSTADLARLRIPAVGVDAAIEPVGVTPQGDLDVPRDARDVGWYASGPQPGQPGDAVIDGHLNWGSGPAVFWKLDELRSGDNLQVADRDGRTLSFRVVRQARYPADKPPAALFSSTGQPRLSLITCAGDWTGTEYSERLVVEAALGG